MNKHLDRLLKISQQNERLIVGLMSGTSLDGLDIALCKFSGKGRSTKLKVVHYSTWDYPQDLRERLRKVASKAEVDQRELAILHSELGDIYAEQILIALDVWDVKTGSVDLIASHGQTAYHAPLSYQRQESKRSATFQIVDADHIAQRTGIITISDFRQKHTAQGGEGAPLASVFDEYLFQDEKADRVLLNLGGIANITYLPSRESGKKGISTDIGPANILINQAMMSYFGLPYDEGGRKALEGVLNEHLLKDLKDNSFFKRPFPKTTGPEDFDFSSISRFQEINDIAIELTSLIATLTQLTIDSVSDAVQSIHGTGSLELFISGGGFYNKAIIEGIAKNLPNAECHPFEKLGVPGDAKEAVMMAFFGNELIMGSEFELGKISLP